MGEKKSSSAGGLRPWGKLGLVVKGISHSFFAKDLLPADLIEINRYPSLHPPFSGYGRTKVAKFMARALIIAGILKPDATGRKANIKITKSDMSRIRDLFKKVYILGIVWMICLVALTKWLFSAILLGSL